jgi:hypothetical protein
MTHSLSRPVRTKAPQGIPVLLRTIGGSIDCIQALPNTFRSKPAWRQAEELLFGADETKTPADVEIATSALEDALRAEGWLHT